MLQTKLYVHLTPFSDHIHSILPGLPFICQVAHNSIFQQLGSCTDLALTLLTIHHCHLNITRDRTVMLTSIKNTMTKEAASLLELVVMAGLHPPQLLFLLARLS